jgi:hypothetical protein
MSGVRPQDRLAWHRQLSADRELSRLAIHIALVISNHFNNGNGECFVGMERLAGEAGIRRRAAVRAVATLAKRGHLRVERGGGRGWANTYAMVVREPYPPSKNCVPRNTVSDPKLCPATTVNCVPGNTPTLKENSKKESEGCSMKKGSKPAAPEDTPSSTPKQGFRIGANGRAVLKVGSPQWNAWLRYYQATGNRAHASLMCHMAESSRWGEWEELAAWPPSHVGPRDNAAQTHSGGQ